MKKAGFGWEQVASVVEGLLRDGQIDAAPGRTKGSSVYFAAGRAGVLESQDGSPSGRFDER
jgi:hypothetical protein